jgi:hypothetical protein
VAYVLYGDMILCYYNIKVIIRGFDKPKSKFAFDKAIFDNHGIRGVFQLTIMLMTHFDLNTRSDRNHSCCFHSAIVTGNDSILALLQIGQFSMLLFIKQVAHQKQVSHNRKCVR